MKIKKSVKSDININVGADNARVEPGKPGKPGEGPHHGEGLALDKKKEACDAIHHAIEILSEIADTDMVAKDSIANLGVVLLDLKSEI